MGDSGVTLLGSSQRALSGGNGDRKLMSVVRVENGSMFLCPHPDFMTIINLVFMKYTEKT